MARKGTQLEDLVDLQALRELLVRFHKVTGLVIAIVDREGKELISAGYRRICTDFHRKNKSTALCCEENESYIRQHLDTRTHVIRACRNGLNDAAYPITIDGEHVATVFSGQFLFEEPDLELFRQQACENGFPEEEYLASLSEVPVYSHEKLDAIMAYYAQFAEMLAQLGLQTKRLRELNRELFSAHDALIRSKSRLRLALRVSGTVTWDRDQTKGSFQVDDSWKLMFGHSPGSIQTFDDFLELVHPDDVARVLRAENMPDKENSQLLRAEFRVRVADGRWRWVQSTGQTIARDGKGHPTRAIGVIQDVTERHEAEQKIQEQRDALAHVSRVSTMGELTASIAHEINQPLTAILNNAQAGMRYLKAPKPDLEELADVLVDVVADAKRASEVIRRLRALLRKGEVEHQEVDINQLVNDTCKLLNSEISMRKAEVSLQLAAMPAPVTGDPVQLQQVLVNLILNGCESMAESDRGDHRLRIRTEAVDGMARLCVRDSGKGIAPGDQEKLFELFYTTKQTGMGTGLAISSSIVEAHGGKLSAENHAEGGAEFCVSLPYATQGPSETSPA